MNFLSRKDKIGAALLLAFSLIYLRFAFDIPTSELPESEFFSARTLPFALSACSIAVSMTILLRRSPEREGEGPATALRNLHWAPAGGLVLAMLAYSMLFGALGFHLATFLFLAAGFLIMGERRLLLVAGLSLALVFATWLITSVLFGMYIDSGDLIRFLFPVEAGVAENA